MTMSDEAGPSRMAASSSAALAGRKRKRTDATTSPRGPKRVAEASETESETEDDTDSGMDDLHTAPNVAAREEDELVLETDSSEEELPYIDIDIPPSTSVSTPSVLLSSLPQSPSPVPEIAASTSAIDPVTGLPSQPRHRSPTAHTPDLLSEYTCPICFSPPSNATLTPCGHICCGSCLFTAVKTTLHRGAVGFSNEPNVARCPVCRASILGWDGRGGGVIGLKPRVVISL